MVELLSTPSDTVNVISVSPYKLSDGLIVTNRSAPFPPIVILLLGINSVLDDTPVTVKLAADVSMSEILNAILSVWISSSVI